MRKRTAAKHAAVLAAPVVIDIAGPIAALAVLSAGVGLLLRRETGRSQASTRSGHRT
jgi:hypothetical protein